MARHPLDPLHADEIAQVVKILNHCQRSKLRFKVITLDEPRKQDLIPYLEAERLGDLLPTPPNRKAYVYFHTLDDHKFHRGVVNITTNTVEVDQILEGIQGPADADEQIEIEEVCNVHPVVLAEIEKLKLPPNARVLNDPWGYGTDDASIKSDRRLIQCYMYAALSDDPEANHYSIPLPFSPVFDSNTKELVRIDRLPLNHDDERVDTQAWIPRKAVEYSTALLEQGGLRQDLKPLQVQQPEGPSFSVDGHLVEWQKWRFRLGWNVREGPLLHNVTYDGRNVLYRLSLSEMTVPYADPRQPYIRKQAFDLGDIGLGMTSNCLTLGCDCLGVIRYFDGFRVNAKGETVKMKNVICMHEIDNGIGWKHTNYRNATSSVVRDRRLVIQCTATVSNYEYILMWTLDQAANIHCEVRATGIVSTMPVNDGVKLPWMTRVADGVGAAYHQHLFNLRIDPAIDGFSNTIAYEDSERTPEDPVLDPYGVGYYAKVTEIERPGGYDLDVNKSRVYKMINPSSINPISGKPAGYKLHAHPSQMMLMRPHAPGAKRALFGSKPIWVTKYQDGELYAAGEFTNQSAADSGLAVWAKRDENVKDTDVVLWHSFGLTHNPRPEDFPVMPMEMIKVELRPTSFFTMNPSNDVPRSNQKVNKSVLVPSCCDGPATSSRL
ncbi:Amine oxidase [Fusarium keratoplasticum]|uniref:Amine oxidase n=1 Tax=Fusarium keratoplasticum TaxID=1328300 RepID=A0ACC0R7M3_9HYPO|nr:Amine oxidase [Fusarium keratoplasticum]KAI8675694.1 Amine oxidase [Fusarium keratoplasticum]